MMKVDRAAKKELPAPIPYSVLRGHDSAVNSIDFVGENHGLISGDVAGSLYYWNMKSLEIIKQWNAHTASVTTVQCINSASTITSGREGCIKLWDLHTTQDTLTFQSNCQHFCNVSSNGGDLIVSSDHSSQILLWDIRTPTQPVGRIDVEKLSDQSLGMLMSVLMASRDEGSSYLVVSGHEDGSVAISDLRTMTNLQVISRQHTEPVFAVVATPSNMSHVLSGGGDSQMIRYSLDATSSTPHWTEDNRISFPQNGTSSITMRSDERIIASSHWDGTVRLFDRKKMKCLGIFRHHRDGVLSVRFGKRGSSEEAVFASCSKDGQVALWNIFSDTYVS